MSDPNTNVSINCTLIKGIIRTNSLLQLTNLTPKSRSNLTSMLNKYVSLLNASKRSDPEAVAYATALFSPTFISYFASEDRTRAEIMKDTLNCTDAMTLYYCNCSNTTTNTYCTQLGCENSAFCATTYEEAQDYCEGAFANAMNSGPTDGCYYACGPTTTC
jgi:hypothetical protein